MFAKDGTRASVEGHIAGMGEGVLSDEQIVRSADGTTAVRRRLYRTAFKYPVVLVEQAVRSDDVTVTVGPRKTYVGDHVLVRTVEGVGRTTLSNALQSVGWSIRGELRAPNTFIIFRNDHTIHTVEEGLTLPGKFPKIIKHASSDGVHFSSATFPDDPLFSELWGLHNSGVPLGIPDADIDAPEAWDSATGNSNVIVAVIDTGVDYEHPDLRRNIWRNTAENPTNNVDDDGNGYVDDYYGWDFVYNDSDPADEHLHGTHVAGTVAAVGNNATGVVGVCWSASIMSVRFLNANGSGTDSDAIDAIYYAVDNGANIINASWGGGSKNLLLEEAIGYANRSNVLFVAAAGNGGGDGIGDNNDSTAHYPSSYTNGNVIAVAAVDKWDRLAFFSNYGRDSVDLAAPGVDILSTFPTTSTAEMDAYGFSTNYDKISGTSMATPHVAGAAALMLSLNPELPVAELKQLLLYTVDTSSYLEARVSSDGRLNVDRAIATLNGIAFDKEAYFLDEEIHLTLFALSAQSTNSYDVELRTTDGDAETLALHRMPSYDYIYTNHCLISDLVGGVAVPGNDVLEAQHGTVISVLFTDPVSAEVMSNSVSVALDLVITVDDTEVIVPYGTSSVELSGRNSGNTRVDVSVSNLMTSSVETFAATNSWTSPAISIADNYSRLLVSGTNTYGFYDEVWVSVWKRSQPGITNYVSPSGLHVWPFDSWNHAATNINEAVIAASPGNTVLVTNGEYRINAEIHIASNVHVRSVWGAGHTIVNGQSQTRCFTLSDNSSILDGFTIQNGKVNNAWGGGVRLSGGGTVRNCVLRDNSGDFEGGGIVCEGGGIVENCVLSNNWAVYGGAIGCVNGGTISNCLIVGNTASSWSAGVDCWDGGSIVACTIVSNAGGHAVYLSADASIVGSSVNGNTAGIDFDRGGFASNCMVHANQGVGMSFGAGGAAYNSSICGNGRRGVFMSGGPLDHQIGLLRNCVIASNTLPIRIGDKRGAGVSMYWGGKVDFCHIHDNVATGKTDSAHAHPEGGGVGVWFKGNIRNSVVAGNQAHTAGGIYMYAGNDYGEGVVENCIISENHATNAGGVYLDDGFEMINCTIVSNTATFCGGVDAEGGAVIANAIAWGNEAPVAPDWAGDAQYSHSCTYPQPPGSGNITDVPSFWRTSGGVWRLRPGSPCIDAGTTNGIDVGAVDVEARTRVIGDHVDIGASEFEGTSGALICGLEANSWSGLLPHDAVFTGFAAGAHTTNVWFSWDIGDDGALDAEGLNLTTLSNSFTAAGAYDIRLTVSNALGEVDSVMRTLHVSPAVLYVSLTGSHTYPYATWDAAASNLQAAVDASADGAEIRVAQGAYVHTTPTIIPSGVTVTGVGGPQGVVLDGRYTGSVVVIEHPDVVLSGLRIIRGRAPRGGGIYMKQGGTITNCIITGCEASEAGTGIYVRDTGGLITHCTVSDNRMYGDYSLVYGAIYLEGNATVANCDIFGNESTYVSAVYVGTTATLSDSRIHDNIVEHKYVTAEAAVRVYGSTYNCLIAGNDGYGVRMGNYDAPGTVRSCLIRANDGGVYFDNRGFVESCTIVGNSGAGIYQNPYDNVFADPRIYEGGVIRNSIISLNGADVDYYASNWRTKGEYCWTPDVARLSGVSGGPNFTNNPSFVAAELSDYHLTDDSPCIDAGTNQTWMASAVDLDGWPRIADAVVDAGCFEHGHLGLALQASPVRGSPPLDVLLRASVSGSNTSDIVYFWDLDNDGSNEVVGAMDTLTNTFESPGSYYVGLTASNAAGVAHAKSDRIWVVSAYYVNDGATNLDAWCSAIGKDSNDGLSPETPMASVEALLSKYRMTPGSRVRIDTGNYALDSTIIVNATNSGSDEAEVIFEASPFGVSMTRTTNTPGEAVWHLNDCDYVVLRTATVEGFPDRARSWMEMSGGYYGLRLSSTAHCRVERLKIRDNERDGIYVGGGSYMAIANNLVVNNGGRGLLLSDPHRPTVENNTMAHNSHDQVELYWECYHPTFRNNILWASSPGYAAFNRGFDTVGIDSDYNDLLASDGADVVRSGFTTYSTLREFQDAIGKEVNSISVDPSFVDIPGGDYHLMSVEGRYVDGHMWVADTHHSPCIDAGDTNATFAFEPPPNGARRNIGAYGNTGQASKSPTNTVWTLRVDSAHGSAMPAVDIHTYYENSLVGCSISPDEVVGSTRHACTGWILAGQADTNGQCSGTSTQTSVILTNHAVLTWLWSTNDWVANYTWDPVDATQYVSVPFPVRVTTENIHGETVTGYTGTVSISAWRDVEATNNIYGDANHSGSGTSVKTAGIQLTPSDDLLVTHVRHYWGEKVTIWKDDGTLLVSQTVASTPEEWVETALVEPVELMAGETYRIAAFQGDGSAEYYYHYSDPPFAFAHGTVSNSCYSYDDAFPSVLNGSVRYFVGVRYTTGPLESVSALPTSTGNFVDGVWTGSVTVTERATNIYLRVRDDGWRKGDSARFNVTTRHTLTVTSAHGGAHPGTETADYDTALEQWVTNSPVAGGVGTQYVCTAGQVTGNDYVQVSPTNVTLTLTNDATLAWQWQTNYWLDTEAGPHGDVTPADSWTTAGANVEVTAVPHLYYHFTGWTGSGTNCIVAGDSSLSTATVAVTMPVRLAADFGENLATNETPEWWLALHGWTNDFDAAALADWDSDGMPTWAEFHADTLPRDGDSVLAITGLSWNVDGVHVMWKGGSNAWQCLEVRRDLVSTGEPWLAIFTNAPPTSVTTNYHYGAGTNGVWFFRVKVWR